MADALSTHSFAALLSGLRMLPHTAMIWDQNRRCVGISRASVYNFTAMESAFLQTQQLDDLPLSQDVKSTWIDRFNDVFAQKTSRRFYGEITVNGNVEHVETTLEYCEHHDINEPVIVSMCRVQLDESGLYLKAAWHSYFSSHHNDVFLLDRAGVIQDVNKPVQGKSRDSWKGLWFGNILHYDDQESFRGLLQRADETGKTVRTEFPIEQKWFEVSVTPWRRGNTKIVRMVAELEDVTLEHTSRIEEQGLVALLNDALSIAEDVILLLHTEGRIIFKNKAAEELFSGNVTHLQDLLHFLNGRLHRVEGKKTLEVKDLNVFKSLESFSKQRVNIQIGDVLRTLESAVQPLHRSGGDANYVLWTLRDVSKDESVIRNLIEENEEMNQILRATAHDLRSSVSNISNLSRLLQQDSSPEKVNVLSDKLISASDTLQHLLGNMLELARMETDHEENQTLIELEQMMEQVLEMLPADKLTDQVLITTDFQVKQVDFNGHYLRSILFNLVANALKYSDATKGKIRIEVRSKAATNGIWLEISDNGIGMDLIEIQEDLFKPFTRFTGKSKGSGIGLSLVKHFAEKNGGEVNVESEPGKGTTFKLLLRSNQQSSGQYELF